MADLLIRNLDDDMLARLTERARAHGRTLESETRLILEDAAGRKLDDALRVAATWRQRLSTTEPHSMDLLREDRQR
jgi:plasmid stability protein